MEKYGKYYVYIHVGINSGIIRYIGKGQGDRADNITERSYLWETI